MVCNRCGHENPEGARYCSSCGSVLGPGSRGADDTTTLVPVSALAAEAEVEIRTDDVPTGSGMLVVKRGPNAGSRFVLEGTQVTAGRSPQADIFLDDITVSRRHADFVPVGADYEVRDAGSLNGTYLNRERIERPMPLANGDEIQIGKFRLVYLVGDAG